MRFPKIDLYHLIVFLYVANEKSITLAAEKLCLTQPTVTNHIKSLEKQINLDLIKVNRKRTELTPAGEGLANYAKDIYRQVISAERFLTLMKETSSIRIGITPMFATTMASAINALLERIDTKVKLNVEYGNFFNLVQDVVDSNIDIAIAPDIHYRDERLSYIRIADEVKLVLYASPQHPIFKHELIDWRDIVNYPLIIGSDNSSMYRILTDKLQSEGVQMTDNYSLSINNVEFCKKLVLNGKNISMAIMDDIQQEVNSKQLKVINMPSDIWIEVDAIIRRGDLISLIIQNFISCSKAVF